MLEQLENSTQNWVSILDSAANKFETITSKILEMRNQMAAYNELDLTTALDFMQQVPDWQKYLSVNNGKIVLNDLDNATLSEMIKKTSGLDNAYKALKTLLISFHLLKKYSRQNLKPLKKSLAEQIVKEKTLLRFFLICKRVENIQQNNLKKPLCEWANLKME